MISILKRNAIVAATMVSIMFFSTISFFSLNWGVAQEDLQGLQSSLPSPTTGPGMSINSSLIPTNITTGSTAAGSIQDRVTVGSFGDDRITGSNRSDIMIGLLGSDTIRGGGGDDKIQGNEDIDKLYGEDGNDLLQGGAATDQLYGGPGNDILSGGMGDNFLVGEQGNDKLYGGSEDDDILAIKC